MVAVRILRQPDIIAYPELVPTPTPAVLDERINAAFDALLASCDDPLTEAQWVDVFALWDARRLLSSADPADWQLAADVVSAVRSDGVGR